MELFVVQQQTLDRHFCTLPKKEYKSCLSNIFNTPKESTHKMLSLHFDLSKTFSYIQYMYSITEYLQLLSISLSGSEFKIIHLTVYHLYILYIKSENILIYEQVFPWSLC